MIVTIKTLRKANKMNQGQLAKKMGVASTYVSAIETGRQKRITLKTIEKFANAFNLRKYELVSLFEMEAKGASEEVVLEQYIEILKGNEIDKATILYNVANTLRAIRIAEQEKIINLSRAFGIAYNDIEKFEQGTKKPWGDVVLKYSKYFGVSMEDMYKLFELETKGKSFKGMLLAYLTLEKQE